MFIISAENADRCHRPARASASCLRDSLLIDWLTVSYFTLCFLFLFLRRLLSHFDGHRKLFLCESVPALLQVTAMAAFTNVKQRHRGQGKK